MWRQLGSGGAAGSHKVLWRGPMPTRGHLRSLACNITRQMGTGLSPHTLEEISRETRRPRAEARSFFCGLTKIRQKQDAWLSIARGRMERELGPLMP